ncbi:NAD-dependent epimerase/dehydratase family protein [Angustibacter aerolatus]
MGRVLVLGGTAWVGREVARQAVAAGHEVLCLARGESGEVADGARLIAADRTRPDAYDEVRGDLDHVVDVSWQPGMVRSAVEALAGRTGRFTYVSSGNVYADHSVLGQVEDAELLPPLAGDTADQERYGEAKVACEQAVTAVFGDGAVLARAGLIAGPGDGSDRFGYWVGRFALAAEAGQQPVLVPDAADQGSQVIDVRDLAAWVLSAPDAGASGPYNLVGDRYRLGDVLAAAREVAGHTGPVVAASQEWLEAHEVTGWSGPRSLTLWLPWADHRGFGARDNARALADGLRLRPVAETLADVLDDERRLGLGRDRSAGLSRDDELALLDELAGSPVSG